MAQTVSPIDTPALENEALALASRMPELLAEASRVALTVVQGVHGRRRAGPGETFWQFRSFEAGDASMAIDWRRSANASHLYVREREWEAAHTVWFWPSIAPSMRFRSHLAARSKAEKALVLTLALASVLTRGGERVGLPGAMNATANRNAPQKLAESLMRSASLFEDMPESLRLPRHCEIIMIGDFLEPLPALERITGALASQGVRGHLIQILDPAEEVLPYRGRVRFTSANGGQTYTADRAETLREAYADRLKAHKQALADHALRLGWSYFIHHTDRPAAETLLSVHAHISGLDKGYRMVRHAIRSGNGGSGAGVSSK